MSPVSVDIERYLDRLGLDRAPPTDLDGLEALQRAHMITVPFENLDVYGGIPVTTDPVDARAKILDRGRGGWCFELNGAFATLLEALGFDVKRIGAAVLLGGPAVMIDHLCLEVTLDEPYLVDVGFGDGFTRPLALNRRGAQDGGTGRYDLLPSPQGTTLTRELDGAPQAQYRFKRVTRTSADFEPASQRLQTDRSLVWHERAFATRLIDGAGDRVTLVGNRLKLQRSTGSSEQIIDDDQWSETLANWFGMTVELDGPATREDDG